MSNSKFITNVLYLINQNLQNFQDQSQNFQKKIEKKIFFSIIFDTLSDKNDENHIFDKIAILNSVNLNIFIYKTLSIKFSE